MAKRETLTLEGEEQPCLNVSATVGVGGANEVGDVMLVQAMFQYIADARGPKQIGLDSKDDVPLPGGEFGTITAHAIDMYQRVNFMSVVSFDGLIHPASYKHRNITLRGSSDPRWGGRLVFMTITLLHFDLKAATPKGGDYTIEITRKFPRLLPWIKR